MNLKVLLLFAGLLGLAACDGSETSPTVKGTAQEGTFSQLGQPVQNQIFPEAKQPEDDDEDESEYEDDERENRKDAIDLKDVDETPSVTQHKMMINGKMTDFTAKAGHLIAYAQKDEKNPEKKDAQAAIFYQAYTRDDLPHSQRPVTFFVGGDINYPSLLLHLGSWGPKRLKVDAPNIPQEYLDEEPGKLDLIDNDLTLLDQTDIVFIDNIAAGYSLAIAPRKNADFENVESDAALLRDFITSYINKNNRQSSPKYLYGSQDGGFLMPLVGRLLQDAGSTNFVPDTTGKPAISLSGIILASTVLDYNTNAHTDGDDSTITGALPTYALIADYHKKLRKAASLEAYANEVKAFANNSFDPLIAKHTELFKNEYGEDMDIRRTRVSIKNPTSSEKSIINTLAGYTGLSFAQWQSNIIMNEGAFYTNLDPKYETGSLDGRLKARKYNPNQYEHDAFVNEIKNYLPNVLNYENISNYIFEGDYWYAQEDPHSSSLPDIAQVLVNDPKLKMLIVHGYYDLHAPFYQTELDLKRAGLNIPVHMFEAGSSIEYTEAARKPFKKLLDKYYSPAAASVLN